MNEHHGTAPAAVTGVSEEADPVEPPATAVRLSGVTVTYGTVRALDGLSLSVPAGSAVAVLGPSGAGKTTLLHVVSGFTAPAAGTVVIGDDTVAAPPQVVPPERRRVGVVFQHYALWPHLSALETVAYPLRRQGVEPRAARRRALELLDQLGVRDLTDRRPAEMSGGQQQRIGVARALARDAVVYCLDEPTAHLDTALRALLQEQIAERRKAMGAAALYATHDAGEALALADEVVLLRDGRLVQRGTPQDVYERPVDPWAAQLTGPASVIQVPVHRTGPSAFEVRMDGHRVPVAGEAASSSPTCPLLVRPEWAELGGPLSGTVSHVWYRGPHTDHRLQTPCGEIDVRSTGPPRARPGDAVRWQLRRGWLLHPSSKQPSPKN